MQTTAIGTVANSLPENEVILLTLLISKGYILFAELRYNSVKSKLFILICVNRNLNVFSVSIVATMFFHFYNKIHFDYFFVSGFIKVNIVQKWYKKKMVCVNGLMIL